ncbi:hypothetical protein ACTFIU_005535 [Dictyostelium citrinum]
MDCINTFENNNINNNNNKNNISEIIKKTVEFVKEEINSYNDPSHDYNHIERVWKLAKNIAQKENYVDPNNSERPTELLELAALLHDVKDHKYLKKGEDENTCSNTIISFLTSNNYPLESAQKIALIVSQISFKNELGNSSTTQLLIESKIVQDADRLDGMVYQAIGAIGIARCFSFGAIKNRPFYGEGTMKLMNSDFKTVDMSQEQYKKQTSPTIDHFYEKLFKLQSLLKTETGKAMGIQRHQFMVDFIKQFNNELNNE